MARMVITGKHSVYMGKQLGGIYIPTVELKGSPVEWVNDAMKLHQEDQLNLIIGKLAKDEKYIQLNYSKKQSDWSWPGKPAYSLTNTGNGFVFVDEKTSDTINLDYCQAQAIRALLKLEDTDGAAFNYMKVK